MPEIILEIKRRWQVVDFAQLKAESCSVMMEPGRYEMERIIHPTAARVTILVKKGTLVGICEGAWKQWCPGSIATSPDHPDFGQPIDWGEHGVRIWEDGREWLNHDSRRFLKADDVERFAAQLGEMRAKARKGYLDSIYAGVRHGRIACNTDASIALARLLRESGFTSHGSRLIKSLLPDATGLKVDAIGTHLGGPAKGYQTLSLGQRLVAKGPGWESYEPVCHLLVPMDQDFKKGQVLEEMPEGALPLQYFFLDWKSA